MLFKSSKIEQTIQTNKLFIIELKKENLQLVSMSFEKHVKEKNSAVISALCIFDGNVARNISRILRM